MNAPNRRWCFTWNNYTDVSETELQSEPLFSYLVYGREIGASGTPHLQGYLVSRRAVRFTQLHAEFPHCHWEAAQRTESACVRYCKKEGDYFERDDRRAGRRSDLLSAIEALDKEGADASEEAHPEVWVKFSKGLIAHAQRRIRQVDAVRELTVNWCYGNPGTGKTYFVVTNDHDLWINSMNLMWFDGYQGQEGALFDDFRDDMCSWAFLLRLLDVYPLQVPVKGGFVYWVPKRIWITNPYHPREAFIAHSHEDVGQVRRRIHHVFQFCVTDTGERTIVEDFS